MRTNYFVLLIRPQDENGVQVELEKNLSIVDSISWRNYPAIPTLREVTVQVKDDTSLLDACELYFELILTYHK